MADPNFTKNTSKILAQREFTKNVFECNIYNISSMKFNHRYYYELTTPYSLSAQSLFYN